MYFSFLLKNKENELMKTTHLAACENCGEQFLIPAVFSVMQKQMCTCIQ